MTGLLLSAARRARRRALKRQTARTADMLLAAWLTVVALIRFTLNETIAVRELSRGSALAGQALAEFSALHALGVALAFTFLVSSLSLGTTGLDKRRLVLSPVPFASTLLSELAGLLSSPVSAIVAAFLLPAAVPFAFFPHPVAAIASLLLCFAAALCIAASASTLLAASPRAGRVAGPLRIVFAVTMVGLVLANFDFQWKGGPVRMFVFTKGMLLDDGAGAGLLPRLRPWSPSAWIAGHGVRPAGGLLLSAGLAAAAAALFGLAVRVSLREAARGPRAAAAGGLPGGLRRRRPVPRGGAGQVMFVHELRSLAARGATLAGAAAALAVTAWTLFARDNAAAIPLFGAVLALASIFPYASNLFGRDGAALARYVMLSPDWGTVFASRSAAHVTAAAALVAPLAAASAARLGAAVALSVALATLLAAALHALYGIASSMLLPSAEAGHRSPPFANQLAVVAAWAAPWALGRAARFGTAAYMLGAGACLAGAAVAWTAVVRRIRARFADDAEAVLERMRE